METKIIYNTQNALKIQIKMAKRITLELELKLCSELHRKRDWITLEPIPLEDSMIFSMSGSIGARMGGQIYDHLIDELGVRENVTTTRKIIKMWKEHHLNDMNSGTKEQCDYLKANFPQEHDYIKQCELLQLAGLYNNHGYIYGHDWLFRKIDKWYVLSFITTTLKINTPLCIFERFAHKH